MVLRTCSLKTKNGKLYISGNTKKILARPASFAYGHGYGRAGRDRRQPGAAAL